MDKFDQMANAVAAAVVASKPPQEYCLLWIDSWATCMTKGEWSGWMQALGAVAAIAGAFVIANWQHLREMTAEVRRLNEENARRLFWLKMLLIHIKRTSVQIAGAVNLQTSVGKLPYMKSQISSAIAPLAAFPFIEIHEKNLVLAVMEILQHANMAEKGFDAQSLSDLATSFSLLSTECQNVLDDYWPESGEAS